ncbi:MAG: PilZ domain-containing protein [Acidobacteriota bacterium]
MTVSVDRFVVQQDVQTYRSADRRIRLTLGVVVQWTNKQGREIKVSTFTDNLSPGGICFIIHSKSLGDLVIGKEIHLTIDELINAQGSVRHITNKNGLIYVGVALARDFAEWVPYYRGTNPHLPIEPQLIELTHAERRHK